MGLNKPDSHGFVEKTLSLSDPCCAATAVYCSEDGDCGDSTKDGCEDVSVGSWIGSGRVNLFSTAKSHLGVLLLGVHRSNSMPESGEMPLLNGPNSSIAA